MEFFKEVKLENGKTIYKEDPPVHYHDLDENSKTRYAWECVLVNYAEKHGVDPNLGIMVSHSDKKNEIDKMKQSLENTPRFKR